MIQARGRRSIPLTYSPDINHTPLRQQMQRAKLAALSQAGGTNSRLLFHLSPEKAGKTSPLTKKLKLDPTISGTSPEVAMKGLNPCQAFLSPVKHRVG